MAKEDMDMDKNKGRDANRDPITKQPGAHPIGTGIGAAAGGVAGGAAAGAAMGSAAGPVGTAAGIAVGAVVGGLAGKGVAEKVDPTAEDAYWRQNYNRQPYFDSSYTYDDYQGAYRTGYEGYGRLGGSGKRYEDVEQELRRDYERNYSRSRLSWDKARPAVRAAWHRFDRNLEEFLGYDVVDRENKKIGTAECLWTDHSGEPAFLGIRTGWLFGKTHVVPSQRVEVSQNQRRLRLPYSEEEVKNAPAYDAGDDIAIEQEREIYEHYGVAPSLRGTTAQAQTQPAQRPAAGTTAQPRREETRRQEDQDISIPLAEEQIKVGKREVEAGGVRLRKIVRTETVNQPVELRREEIVVERVAAQGGQATGAFDEKEIYVPLRREEPVVEKETRLREEVRVKKTAQTDRQEVSEQVRKEDIEIERSGEASESRFDTEDPTKGTPASEIRERETKPRSQRQMKD